MLTRRVSAQFFATVFLALFVATSAFAPAPTRCFGVKVVSHHEHARAVGPRALFLAAARR